MFDRRKPVGKVVALPVEQIEPSPYQARRVFDQEELAGLAASIRENGLLQPVTVRRLGPDRYELIAGERRLRACKLAGMDRVPAILRDYQDNQTAALSLLENIQRADLNPFEQARGLQDVLALWGCTQAEAAKRLGMAQPTLANKLRLLQLTADQQQFILIEDLYRMIPGGNLLVIFKRDDGKEIAAFQHAFLRKRLLIAIDVFLAVTEIACFA